MDNSNKKNLAAKRVMVAMSGGVDSSVAAYLLQKSGYDVTGVTMHYDIADVLNNCPERPGGIETKKPANHVHDAANVCKKLGIGHHVFNLSSQMNENVIYPFIKEYISGKTPNPCVECNRLVKFGFLFNRAMEMGFDFFATGHYARIIKKDGTYHLAKSGDCKKDQSYFLYVIKKEELSRILFPLSGYKKEEVRDIARDAGFPVAEQAESQEVCFIPGDDYKGFIKRFIKNNINSGTQTKRSPDIKFNAPGDIIDIYGKTIKRHEGICNFTIGQRKGIGISAEKPLYVLGIDPKSNTVKVGDRQFLKKEKLLAGNLNLLETIIPERAKAQIRYNHKEAPCSIKITGKIKKAEISFDQGQDAITCGQSVVFYDNDIVLGGGIIEKVYENEK